MMYDGKISILETLHWIIMIKKNCMFVTRRNQYWIYSCFTFKYVMAWFCYFEEFAVFWYICTKITTICKWLLNSVVTSRWAIAKYKLLKKAHLGRFEPQIMFGGLVCYFAYYIFNLTCDDNFFFCYQESKLSQL